MTTAGVLLAAGAGSRYEGSTHKLLAPFRGQPLVRWAAESVLAAGFDEIVVIVGAVDLRAALPPGLLVVENPEWPSGQASSLRAAVSQAHDHDHEAIVVGLGDQPLVTTAAWAAVGGSRSPVAVATYEGVRRNPVRLHRSVWSLLPDDGDQGARRLVRDRDDLVEEVPCRGSPVDIDTPEDLARWS